LGGAGELALLQAEFFQSLPNDERHIHLDVSKSELMLLAS
jgi:hypothetical protein